MSEKNETTIVERLKDPYSIYSILMTISYIVMLILYFVLPVLKSYEHKLEKVTYYYWNGNLFSGELISTGVNETYPVEAHIILIISMFLLLSLSITQIVIVIFKKNLTKMNFLNIFIIPSFVFNSLLLFGIFSYVHWMRVRTTTDFVFNMETPLIYILLIGILLTIVILGFATILTIIEKRKGSRRIQYS